MGAKKFKKCTGDKGDLIMKKFKWFCGLIILVLVILSLAQMCAKSGDCPADQTGEKRTETQPKLRIEYTSLGVPNIDTSFKTYMSYQAVTNRQSNQYKLIHTWGFSDSNGFMRCKSEQELGIQDDYYMIALGSYYGTDIGTKYRITTDTGNVFYGVLADCKDNKHTNSTNQYVPSNGNVVEFLVDTSKLLKEVKTTGSANIHTPLNGKIISIERIEFIN